jgi:drug/metabolite transporter (DMT)-like permease
MSRKIYANVLLILAALIWGGAFVAQSIGLDFLEPFVFNGLRMLIGCASLLPYILIKSYVSKKRGVGEYGGSRTLVFGGIICGIVLFIASALQQVGLQYTTAGKAGFITALYIVLVPVLGIVVKRKVHFLVWIATAVSAFGLYFLTMKENLSIGFGETLVVLCAVFFAMHILAIGFFAPRVDGIKMSCIQFLTAGSFSMICAVFFETVSLQNIIDCILPLLYMGVLSSGVAYTLQILGQKHTPPAVASLIMSLESVFAALAGWAVLGEILTMKERFGCVMVFAGIILAQMPQNKNI